MNSVDLVTLSTRISIVYLHELSPSYLVQPKFKNSFYSTTLITLTLPSNTPCEESPTPRSTLLRDGLGIPKNGTSSSKIQNFN